MGDLQSMGTRRGDNHTVPMWRTPDGDGRSIPGSRRHVSAREAKTAARATLVHARRGPRLVRRGGKFLEVFSGSGRLSQAMRRCGVSVLPAVDWRFGPRRLDLHDEDNVRVLKRGIISQSVKFLHLGVPCTTFSAALRGAARMRSVACPVGPEEEVDKIRKANFLVRQSVKLCVLMEKLGGWWSIENPLGSLLWRMPEVVCLSERAFRVCYDACQFGANIPGEGPFMKPSLLLTNAPWLRCLGRRCPPCS